MSEGPREKRPLERVELDRLRDVQKAIEEIQGHPRFPEGKSAWDDDKYYRGYCERQLAIVGEAASKLAAEHEYEKLNPDVPWNLIKGLRNILVHAYWRTDKEIIWKIIDQHLPELQAKIDRWIKEKEESLKDHPEPQKGPKKEGKLSRKIRELSERTNENLNEDSPQSTSE